MTTHPAGHGGTAPDTERRAAPQAETRAHTPGPWQLAENDTTLVLSEALDAEGNARLVADVLCVQGPAKGEDFANARLIAAAPELLAALRLCLENLDGIAAEDDIPSHVIREQARAAINRATGDATDQPVTEAEVR